MRFSTIASVAVFLLLPSVAPAQTRQVPDSVAVQVTALKAQVAAMAQKQREMEGLLKEVSTLLHQIESTSNSGATSSCKGVQATQNQWLKFDVSGCAALSRDRRSLSFTVNIKNISVVDTLFIGVPCCYAGWLKIVDDQGRAWQGGQGTVTALPTYQNKDYVQLAPGGDFSVTAAVVLSSRSTAVDGPRLLSITGELLRRTPSEQRLIDRGQDSFRNQGHLLPFGIARIPVEEH